MTFHLSKVNRSLLPWYRRSICLLLLFVMPVMADTHSSKVAQVKAAFIYNIAKFVIWEENDLTGDHLNICFYRKDFIGEGFNLIQGREVHGKHVKKTVVQNLEEARLCNILLMSDQELTNYHEEYTGTEAVSGLLTIADLTTAKEHGEVSPGVLLSLIRRGKSIGFEVSLNQVRERHLQMSSQLLKLAHILDGEGS